MITGSGVLSFNHSKRGKRYEGGSMNTVKYSIRERCVGICVALATGRLILIQFWQVDSRMTSTNVGIHYASYFPLLNYLPSSYVYFLMYIPT